VIRSFARRARRLQIACLAFAALGIALAFLGERALLGELPPAERELWRWMAGPIGATMAGRWYLASALARRGIARGRRWAHDASIAALLAAFVVGAAAAFVHGGGARVWLVTLVPLGVAGIALALTREGLRAEAAPAATSRWSLALEAVCGVVALAGVAVAVTPEALPPYQQAIERRFAPFDLGLERLLFGLLGGEVVGQAVLLYALARRAIRAGERWATRAALESLLLWFAVDSVVSFAADAAFNVWMVNLPSLLALGVPLVALHRRAA
jgi:hypothetical protein